MIGGHNQDSVRVSMAGRHPVEELPQSTVALGDTLVIAQPQQVDFVLHRSVDSDVGGLPKELRLRGELGTRQKPAPEAGVRHVGGMGWVQVNPQEVGRARAADKVLGRSKDRARLDPARLIEPAEKTAEIPERNDRKAVGGIEQQAMPQLKQKVPGKTRRTSGAKAGSRRNPRAAKSGDGPLDW